MPERFGRYELLRRIGAGGMAEAFVAKTFGAEGFVKEVVIKRILPAFSEDPDFVRMFINEARLAAKLQHTNIVQIYDFNHVDGIYYIAMEWVDGVDLRRVMNAARSRAQPVPLQVAVHVGVETIKGLHYAHSKSEGGAPLQLVHRDISPHNLLLSFAGEVKLTDFGIAKAAAQASATRSGAVKGKLAYMSPEQVAGSPLDSRSDLFSLGIIFWELLAGRRLYQADSEMELFARVRKGEIPPLRQLAPEVPEALEAFSMRLLAADLEQRYATAAEALADLGPFAEVGNSLALSEYLRRLLPAEAERDKKGVTAVYSQVVAPAFVQSAGPEAPTHTRFTAKEQAAAADYVDSGQDPDLVPLPPREPVAALRASAAGGYLGEQAQPEKPRKGRGAAVVALAAGCLAIFAGIGWWIGLPRGAASASAGLAEEQVAQLEVATRPPLAAIAVDGVAAGRAPLELQGRVGVELLLSAEFKDGTVTTRKRLAPGRQRVLLELAAEQQRAGAASLGSPGPGQRADGAAAPRASAPAALPAKKLSAKGKGSPLQHQPVSPAAGVQEQPLPRAGKPARRVASPARASLGILDVVVSPWARVKVDGKEIGQTPIKGHRLRVGVHMIELTNSELNKREKIKVRISARQRSEIRRDWGY